MTLLKTFLADVESDPWLDIETPTGAAGAFQSAGTYGRCLPLCWLTGSRYACVGQSLGGGDVHARVIDISDSTGAATISAASDIGNVVNIAPPRNIGGGAIARISAARVAVGYRINSSPYHCGVKVSDLSGAAFSSETVKTVGSGSGYSVALLPFTSSMFVWAWNYYGGNEIIFEVGTISGTTIVYTAHIQLQAVNRDHISLARVPGQNAFVVTWCDATTNSWKACVCQVNPTTGAITKGMVSAVDSTWLDNPVILMFSATEGIIIGNRTSDWAVVGKRFTLSGTVMTFPAALFIVYAEGSIILNQTGAVVYDAAKRRFMYAAKNKALRLCQYNPRSNAVTVLASAEITHLSHTLHHAPSLALRDDGAQLCMTYVLVSGSTYAIGASGINRPA